MRPQSSMSSSSSSWLSSASFSYRSPFAASVEEGAYHPPPTETDADLTIGSLADSSPLGDHRSSLAELELEVLEHSSRPHTAEDHTRSSSSSGVMPRGRVVRNVLHPELEHVDITTEDETVSAAAGVDVCSAEARQRVAELLKVLDASVKEIRAYFQCARNGAETSRLGNDHLNPKVAGLVRGALCSVLAGLFSNGFRVSKRKRQNHIWHFMEKVSTKAGRFSWRVAVSVCVCVCVCAFVRESGC
jgi:hypothetical protein